MKFICSKVFSSELVKKVNNRAIPIVALELQNSFIFL